MTAMHGLGEPSAWLLRWAHLLPAGGRALDVACGAGRHLRWLADHGFATTGVDRDATALAAAREATAGRAETVAADIEAGPWPFDGRSFDAVLVFNYLWRPLWPALLASLAPGGVLVYETFALGQQTLGRPARREFLLEPGELLVHCAGLRVVGFEDGFEDGAEGGAPRFVQRIAAVREPAGDAPPRHRLPAR